MFKVLYAQQYIFLEVVPWKTKLSPVKIAAQLLHLRSANNSFMLKKDSQMSLQDALIVEKPKKLPKRALTADTTIDDEYELGRRHMLAFFILNTQ